MSEAPVRGALASEVQSVAKLAAPIVTVQLGLMFMGTVDTMMLGRLSEQALASGALGNTISFAMLVVGMGLLIALDPLISQAWGAEDHGALAANLQRGLVMAALISVPISLAMWDAEPLLRLLDQDPRIVDGATAYIRGLIPGNLAFLVFIALRQTLNAMGKIGPAVWAILAANLVNAGANYLLIFGHGGFPVLGVAGSAYATSIARWVMCLGLLAISWPDLRRYFRRFTDELRRFSAYLGMLRIGIPVAVLISAEMWIFSVVALLMGHLGSRELAAHQIALSLAALSYQVPLGIAAAASVRVGNAIGRGEGAAARYSAKVCLALGAGVMLISASAFGFLPGWLARLYTPETEVIGLAIVLIPIAAIFQVFDGLQVVGAGVLRGAADTRIPAAIGLFAYWGLGLPLGWWLAFRNGLGPSGLWWGLTLGLAAAAVMLILRVRFRFRRELLRVAV